MSYFVNEYNLLLKYMGVTILLTNNCGAKKQFSNPISAIPLGKLVALVMKLFY